MPTATSFHEAIASAEGKKHALLGNGFSRACFENIFSYDALFDQANFEGLSNAAHRAFAALDTTDFEVVIRGLKQSAVLTAGYPCVYVTLSASSQATNFATVVAHLWQANAVNLAMPSAILN